MKLSDELERAKQELAEVEAQVLRLEKEEKQDAAATTIQSGARMRRAKLEVERQKLAMIQQQQEVERREQELNAHTETMKGKEAARDEYRQKRLSEQQDRREALLNKKMAEKLELWVKAGGHLIALQQAATWVEDNLQQKGNDKDTSQSAESKSEKNLTTATWQ